MEFLFDLAVIAVPFVIAIGVLRDRLLGIEVVVRRTLLYGALTGLVIAVYAATTATIAAAVPEGSAPQLLAAALIAVGLLPARSRLQAVVDRIVYGERRDPVGAVTRLGSQVMQTDAAEPLPTVLAALVEALRTPYAALRGTDGVLVAERGILPAAGAVVVLPLRVGGRPLGDLALATRRGECSLPDPDQRLVDALLPLVALVVHVSRLNAEVETARRRAVLTGLAERDRIRRDLHDGLGPALSGVALGLEAAETALRSGDNPTATLLSTATARGPRRGRGRAADHRRAAAVRSRPAGSGHGSTAARRVDHPTIRGPAPGAHRRTRPPPAAAPRHRTGRLPDRRRGPDQRRTTFRGQLLHPADHVRRRPDRRDRRRRSRSARAGPQRGRPGLDAGAGRSARGSLHLDNGQGTRVAAHLPLEPS